MSFFLATSSSSSLPEIWAVSLAALGGIIVFLGLLLEKIAERKAEKHIVKPCKLLSEWGWYILMLGIAVEIGVASWTAIDDWEIRQNTPAKMRVSSIEATADFFVETNCDNPGTIWGSPGDSAASLVLSEKPNLKEQASTNDLQVVITCDVAQCRLYMTHPGTSENRWVMTLHFVMEPTDEYFSAKSLSRPAEELQKN